MKILFEWLLSVLVAFLLIQTLFFKFTASEESVYIFSTIGMEPWGRILTGVFELIAGLMILTTSYRVYGALLSMIILGVAIFYHLTTLGIEVMGDDGQLFYYAISIFISSMLILMIRKKDIPFIG